MTQSTASFLDQLELAATGQDIIVESVEELIETVEEEIVKEEPIEEEKELFTGTVENAMQELSSLFEGTFAVSIPPEEPEEEVISIPQLVAEELSQGEEKIEIIEEEPAIEPTISSEAIETATTELMDLFEVVAGIDLSTGEKIEPPVVEEPIPLPVSYSSALNGSQNHSDVLSIPKFVPTETEKQNAAATMVLKDWASATKNIEASKVITDVTNILERHKDIMPPQAYKVLESDAVDKTVDYINDHVEISEAEFSNNQSMPFTGANLPLVSQPQFTFAVGNILRKMMATGPGSGDVELVNLEDVDASNISATHQFLAWDAAVEKFVAAEGTTPVGDISGVTAGAGLTGGGTQGTVELDVGAGTGITVNANDIQISATYAGQSSIVTLGTVTTGTWQGTAVANAYLGTGINATKLANGTVTNTELQYINSLSSNAQTQITAVKTTADAAASTGFTIAMSAALG